MQGCKCKVADDRDFKNLKIAISQANTEKFGTMTLRPTLNHIGTSKYDFLKIQDGGRPLF